MNSYNSSRSGRVEVQHKGVWGTICGNSWDFQDANVVCRQLGFEEALATFRNAGSGPRTGPVWLNEVRCVGNESSISECVHIGWGDHDCWHNYDAGVVCRPTSKAMIYLQSRFVKFKKTHSSLMTRMLLQRDVVEPHSIAVKLGSLGNGLKTIKSNQKKP